MNLSPCDIRCCVLIRGTRSSTTEEMILNYCKKYGQINYSHCVMNTQEIMRGYNVVFKQEQSVNRFMDTRPHRIDGQTVKVKRCVASEEEWQLTDTILLTTSSSDNSSDKDIFHEQLLRDYFCRYGAIRACQLDIYHDRPCAYLTFTDYDRVDQLINDKPHMINKINVHVRKHFRNDVKTMKYRERDSSIECQFQTKKRRRQQSPSKNDLIKTVTQQLENKYENYRQQLINIEQNESEEVLLQLEQNVENLLKQIRNLQTKKQQTFNDQLFSKYTIEYILSLTKTDIEERSIELEKESQLLLLIKQILFR